MRKYAARRSAEQWKELLEAQRRSGLTGKEFAQQRGINLGTLRWWKARLGREQSEGLEQRQRMKLLPVVPLQEQTTVERQGLRPDIADSGGMVLHLPGDVVVEMSHAPSAQWLARLCIELEMP